jgi:hypothetical protein
MALSFRAALAMLEGNPRLCRGKAPLEYGCCAV